MSSLTVRRPVFEFPQDIDLMPDKNDPLYSAFTCAVTIIAPHIERYLIRNMRKAKAEIKDEELLQELQDFCDQEANHFRNHDVLNEILRSKLSAAAAAELAKAEADLQEDYRRFSNTKSLRFNLAYAEGFESATCGMSLWAFKHNTLQHSEPHWRDLIEWHLAEEIEHRCVAYDVYHAIGGHYGHRIIWGSYGQAHLLKYLYRFGCAFMQDFTTPEQPRSVLRQRFWSLSAKLGRTLLPWYSPHNIKMQQGVNQILDRVTDARAVQ